MNAAAPIVGTPSGPDDLIWQAAAVELAPAKSLAKIETRAAFIFSNLALVGTIVAGVGLFTGTPVNASNQSEPVRRLFGLVFASVLFALLANLPTFKDRLSLTNLVEVERFYTGIIRRRGWCARVALLLFSVAIAYAFWIVLRLSHVEPEPRLGLQITVTEGGEQLLVTGTLAGERLPEGTVATTTMRGLNGDEAVAIASDITTVGSAGALSATVKVDKVQRESYERFTIETQIMDDDDVDQIGPIEVALG